MKAHAARMLWTMPERAGYYGVELLKFAEKRKTAVDGEALLEFAVYSAIALHTIYICVLVVVCEKVCFNYLRAASRANGRCVFVCAKDRNTNANTVGNNISIRRKFQRVAYIYMK